MRSKKYRKKPDGLIEGTYEKLLKKLTELQNEGRLILEHDVREFIRKLDPDISDESLDTVVYTTMYTLERELTKEFRRRKKMKGHPRTKPIKYLSEDLREQPIRVLNLKKHPATLLRKEGILRVKDLLERTRSELLNIHNMGESSVDHIEEMLREYDLFLRKERGDPE